MKRMFALFLTLLFCMSPIFALVHANELPRIAVYVTGDMSANEKDALGTRMLAALVNSGRYRGIERSGAFLAEIEREHETQRSGAIDDDQISALGRQFGVLYVCVANITPAFGAYQVSARIINVETAEVVFIGDGHSNLQTMDDLTQVSNEVVSNMFRGQITIPQPQVQAERQPRVRQPQTAEPREGFGLSNMVSEHRRTIQITTGSLAAVGLIGGLIYNGRVADEFDKYEAAEIGSAAESTARSNTEDNMSTRNFLYTIGIIGAAGLTLTFFF